ncbi:hypothetical protein G6F36_011121 [Rhizopus arrhizus]|nr:hypothetical protein G6F36_011121 [Rhizopus arrhizus]
MLNLNAKIPLPEKTEFQFFKDNTLSNWKFEDYLQFRLGTDKSGSSLGANKIFSQYCQIMNEIKTKLRNEEVKKYVTKLLNINDYKNKNKEQTVVSNNFHNVNYCTTSIMEAHGSEKLQGSKKRKVKEDTNENKLCLEGEDNEEEGKEPCWDFSSGIAEEEEKIVVIEDVDVNIWEVWTKVLELMKEDNINQYSLDHLNFIQVDKRIKSKNTSKYYPKDLIEMTLASQKKDISPLYEDAEFYNNIFDIIAVGEESLVEETLVKAVEPAFFSKNIIKRFFLKVVSLFAEGLFVEDSDAYKLEISYNHLILWPILQSLCKTISNTKFSVGEIKLEAMSKELKLLKNDNSHYYNADGIIKNTKNHLEMGILETTGPLLITNDQKETNDNIKSGFGLVAMLHTIGREFFYATKIRIWRVSMPAEEIYLSTCIGSVVVPTNANTSEEQLRQLIDNFWQLRTSIMESCKAIEELKDSHIENMKIKTRRLKGHENGVHKRIKRFTLQQFTFVPILKS